jgi:AcrR family transcriptional regulator
MTSVDVIQGRKPVQARSRERVARILAAATEAIAERGSEHLKMADLATRAGVSVGSLYQYFPNKAALAVALIDQERERLAVALEAAVASVSDAPLLEGLSRLARLAIDQQFQDPVFAAARDHEERRLPIGTRLASSEIRLVGAILQFLEDHRDELPTIPHGSPEEVARDLLLITRVLVDADAHGGQGAPPSLHPRLVRALSGYLLAPGVDGRSAGPSAASVRQFQGHDTGDDQEHAQVPHQRGRIAEEHHAHQEGP